MTERVWLCLCCRRLVIEREVLAPCMDLLWQCCEQTTCISPDRLDDATYRLSLVPPPPDPGQLRCIVNRHATLVLVIVVIIFCL